MPGRKSLYQPFFHFEAILTVGDHDNQTMKRPGPTLDLQDPIKTPRRAIQTSSVESSSTAVFVRACRAAKEDLLLSFPSSAQLHSCDGRLADERVKLQEAHKHLQHVQTLMFLMQSHEDHIPIQWTTQLEEEGCRVICPKRSWLRHGLYAEALRDIDACITRIAMSLRNIEVDVSKQEALVRVADDRHSAADHFTFTQVEEGEQVAQEHPQETQEPPASPSALSCAQ